MQAIWSLIVPSFCVEARLREWHSDRLDFFVDDKKYFTYAKEKDAKVDVWPFDQPHYLILNLAIGGAWGGQHGIDDAILPQRFELDYVRFYQQAE